MKKLKTLKELVERSNNNNDLDGLGTTCIAVLKSGDKLAMAHIGDSRACYVITDLNKSLDPSFVQYLVQTGQLTQKLKIILNDQCCCVISVVQLKI